jgi:DNA-binding GntR family transcriptional regulator
MPPPSALPRQTLVSTAVEALRKRIIGGEFQIGESLNQVTIAREYAISRIPLREAMRQLEAEGLLVFQPGKGAVVSGLSLSEIGEVTELRSKIEPDLLVKAIGRLTSSDLERAKSILDEWDVAFKKNDVATWGELNWRFHSTLYAPSECVITMGILQNLHHLNERYARVQISTTHWEQRAAQEHRALLALCRKRQRRKAAQLLTDHILTAGQALISVLEERRSEKDRMAKA